MASIDASGRFEELRTAKGSSVSRGISFSYVLLAIVLIAIPFNGIAGPSVLGELSLEATFFPCALLIALYLPNVAGSLFKRKQTFFRLLAVAVILLFIIVNFYVNYPQIKMSQLGGKAGAGKFLNSIMVLSFYLLFSFALFSFLHRSNIKEFFQHLQKTILRVALFLSTVWIVEFISWYAPGLRATLRAIRPYVSTGPWFQVGRIYGVSYEPSFNAAVIIGFWPMLAFLLQRPGNSLLRKVLLFSLVCIFIAVAFVSDSRTATVAVLLQLGLFLALCWTTKVTRYYLSVAVPIFLAVLFPIGFWYVLASDVSSIVLADHSTSNITRLSAISALIRMWSDHPFLGLGIGQFGFQYRAYASSISSASWEVMNYFYGASWDSLSPSYSLHWRLLAENGIFGALLFFLPFVFLFSKVAGSLLRSETTEQRNGLIMIQVGLTGCLLFGISFDSFRNPFLWIYVALAAAAPAMFRLQKKSQS